MQMDENALGPHQSDGGEARSLGGQGRRMSARGSGAVPAKVGQLVPRSVLRANAGVPVPSPPARGDEPIWTWLWWPPGGGGPCEGLFPRVCCVGNPLVGPSWDLGQVT